MRSSHLYITLTLVLSACGDGQGGNSDDTGAGPAIQIDFGNSVNAKSVEATATDEIISAQRAMNLVTSGLLIAATDPAVIDRMIGGSPPDSVQCWIGPVVAQSAFLLDYSPCGADVMSGGLSYKEPPNGPTTWQYNVFTIDTSRVLDGTIGFEGTPESGDSWAMFDTTVADPDQANRQALSATVDGIAYSVSVHGGASMVLSPMDKKFSQWSAMSITPAGGGDTVEFALGDVSFDSVNSISRPSDPLRSDLVYDSCRCPTTGTIGLDLAMEVSAVTIDLNKLKVDDDGVEDPFVTVPVSQVVTGDAAVSIEECGGYETEFTSAEDVEVTVSGADLATAISGLCSSAIIEDANRCTALQSAANNAGDILVSVGEAKLAEAASSTVDVDFDNAYCKLN